jgi:hypothetical protein
MRDAPLEAGRASLVVVTFGRPPVTGSVAGNRAAPDSLDYPTGDTPDIVVTFPTGAPLTKVGTQSSPAEGPVGLSESLQ